MGRNVPDKVLRGPIYGGTKPQGQSPDNTENTEGVNKDKGGVY